MLRWRLPRRLESVTTLIGDRSFAASGLAGFAAGWFTLGRLTWTSRPNTVRTAEVAAHSVSAGVRQIALLEPPVRPIGVGDGFDVVAGCDKRLETCRGRFGNAVNFRGFPHIPRQELGASLSEPRRCQCGRRVVSAADPERVIAAARGWLGTPYP